MIEGHAIDEVAVRVDVSMNAFHVVRIIRIQVILHLLEFGVELVAGGGDAGGHREPGRRRAERPDRCVVCIGSRFPEAPPELGKRNEIRHRCLLSMSGPMSPAAG